MKKDDLKLPTQVQFHLLDEKMRNDLTEIMTQFNMVRRDKIYKCIFKAGLEALLSRADKLNLKDFE